MQIHERQFAPYQHHCLTEENDASVHLHPYCRTPYQRSWFLASERFFFAPTNTDLEIFQESGEWDRAIEEFNMGVSDARAEAFRKIKDSA